MRAGSDAAGRPPLAVVANAEQDARPISANSVVMDTPSTNTPRPPIHGRGASHNPLNRFDRQNYVADENTDRFFDDDEPSPHTQCIADPTKQIITSNNSPDVPFERSVNPYRGCEHGCIYCFARPTHEYLGYSAGLDFETRILVKYDAASLLRKELASRSWQPQVIAMSGVTDPYQPIERRLGITRACLEVLAEFRNPVGMITKSHLVTRDVDLLSELARHEAASVCVSVTTLDDDLARILEPRAARPARRLAAVEALAAAGVPVGVLVAPIIPAVNDHEILSIVKRARKAGASFAGHVPLRLPHAVAALFESWLAEHMPARQAKVLSRIRSIRGGKLNDPNFHSRFAGEGEFAAQIHTLFRIACQKAGFPEERPQLSTAAFRRPGPAQLTLFD